MNFIEKYLPDFISRLSADDVSSVSANVTFRKADFIGHNLSGTIYGNIKDLYKNELVDDIICLSVAPYVIAGFVNNDDMTAGGGMSYGVGVSGKAIVRLTEIGDKSIALKFSVGTGFGMANISTMGNFLERYLPSGGVYGPFSKETFINNLEASFCLGYGDFYYTLGVRYMFLGFIKPTHFRNTRYDISAQSIHNYEAIKALCLTLGVERRIF